MAKTRKCLFCGASPTSREHVIPEWLSKRMQIRNFGFHPARLSSKDGLEVRPLTKCEHLYTKQVCAGCNNGWMSELESWAQSRFGAAVEPEWPAGAIEELKALRLEAALIIRWLLKTAIMVECAFPRGDLYKVHPDLIPVAYGRTPPTDFHVWAAQTVEPSFLMHFSRGFRVWNGGVLEPYQIHQSSMDFALQLHHFAIRLIRCPSAAPGVKLPFFLPDGRRATPMVLSSEGTLPFPQVHLYPDFACFLDALEVHAAPPQNSPEK